MAERQTINWLIVGLIVICAVTFALFVLYPLPQVGGEATDETRRPSAAVSDLRMVSLHFKSGAISKHVVHKDQVATLAKASLRLHHEPGVNPHNEKETAKLREIFVWKLAESGPYWWTSPSLRAGDKDGAPVFDWRIYHQLWPEKREPLPRGW